MSAYTTEREAISMAVDQLWGEWSLDDRVGAEEVIMEHLSRVAKPQARIAELEKELVAMEEAEQHYQLLHHTMKNELTARAKKAEEDARWFMEYADPFMQDNLVWDQRAKPYEETP